MSATIQIAPMALLEAKLVQKLEEKKAQGWTINPDAPLREATKECCLLCAQLDSVTEFDGDYQKAAAQRLNIPYWDARALESGFMGVHQQAQEPDALYALGLKLRRQYVEAA